MMREGIWDPDHRARFLGSENIHDVQDVKSAN